MCTPTTTRSRRSIPPSGSPARSTCRCGSAAYARCGPWRVTCTWCWRTSTSRPALTLGQAFTDATIDVYADGLTGYGPTRSAVPAQVGTRVQRVLHPDLVPGVRPLLLREFAAQPVSIATESFRRVLATLRVEAEPADLDRPQRPTAVLLAQDLTAPSLLTKDEEHRLHLEMVEAVVAAGYADLVFKPPPGGTGRSDRSVGPPCRGARGPPDGPRRPGAGRDLVRRRRGRPRRELLLHRAGQRRLVRGCRRPASAPRCCWIG